MRSPEASAPRATGGRGVRDARRPRRTLCSHDRQRASRKLSVHAVALCASWSSLHCPGATRPRQARSRLPHAFGLPAIDSGWTLCATSTASAAAASTTTTTMHGPTHRWLRQALRHDNDAQPGRFSHGRPAWPRRALRSHDHQRAPRKPKVPPLYYPGATRPRQAGSRLTSRFRVASYCRRVDLVCD
jgi:hypothetical protein